MGVTTTIDRYNRRVFTVAVCELTFDQLLDAVSGLLVNPAFNPEYDHLMDLSGVRIFNLNTSEVIRFAGRGIFSETSRRAVVAPSNEAFGITNVYVMFRKAPSENLRIFRNIDEAREWLDGTVSQ